MKRVSLLPGLAVAVVGGVSFVASCTNVNTSPTHAVAIEFDSLPFPAIVAGDSLRDSLGVAAPLRAIAYNGNFQQLDHSLIRYIAFDTGLTIDANGFVTAQSRNGAVRLLATVGALQSVTKSIEIARRPDSVAIVGLARDTLFYKLPDDVAANVSPELSVKLITGDSSGGIHNTKGWLVSWQAFYRGNALLDSDTITASLWDEGKRVSRVDTTGTDGIASRVLRVRPVGLTTKAESLIVLATVRYRGAQVRGSPVRFVLHTRPAKP